LAGRSKKVSQLGYAAVETEEAVGEVGHVGKPPKNATER
jgi:hypothetical protein